MEIAIVGMGGMGRVYAKTFRSIPGAHVTAVVSSTAAKGDPEVVGAWIYPSMEAMIDNEHIDVCCICTPTFLHPRQIAMALSAGINVIAEKPLALHAADAVALYDVAREHGVRLFTAQVVRFAHPSRILAELISSGRYGRVLNASFSRLSTCPHWSKDGWVFDAAKSGHVPFDLHIHDLDLIVGLFGIPRACSMRGSGNSKKPYYEHCRFTYEYDNMQISAEAAWYGVPIPFTVEWRVCFESAVVQCFGDKVTLFTHSGPPEIFEPERDNVIDTGINVPATDMYREELIHFLKCVKDDIPSDVVSDDDVISVISILERLMAEGGTPY